MKSQRGNYFLLKFINESKQPVGSWMLKAQMDSLGIKCSTATIGRYLKMLDCDELTIPCGNQGRILSEKGVERLKELDAQYERTTAQEKFSKGIQVEDYEELIDLLQIRKILEIEATRMAAQNASEQDIQKMMWAVQQHRECVARDGDPTYTGLQFHIVLAEICHNKFLLAILNMLVFEEKRIESRFDWLLIREVQGRENVEEHTQIANAIAQHDSEMAVLLMERHLNALIKTTREQAK